MKRALWMILLLLPEFAFGQPSYWWQQMERKPDAQQSQQFFFWPGSNIIFTYSPSNRVVINGTGGGGGGAAQTNISYTAVTNAPWQIGSQNLTNWALYSTNTFASTNFVAATSNALASLIPNPQTNISFTAVTNAPWQTGSANLTNWSAVGTNAFVRRSGDTMSGALDITVGGLSVDGTVGILDQGPMQVGNGSPLQPNQLYLQNFKVAANGSARPQEIINNVNNWLALGQGSTNVGSDIMRIGAITAVAADWAAAPPVFTLYVAGGLTVYSNAFFSNNIVVKTNITSEFGQFNGNGAGLTNTPDWHTNGNTVGASGAFLGTLDAQPMIFKVNSAEAGRITTINGVTFGSGNSAPASASIAMGLNNTASGPASAAFGGNSSATTQGAFAAGNNCHSTGAASFTSGDTSASAGDYSFAAGLNNVTGALAEGSAAMGEASVASGIGSFALGIAATANNDGSFVWSDSNGSGFTDSAINQFVVGSSGGVFLDIAPGTFWIDGFSGLTTSFTVITGPSAYSRANVYKGIVTNVTAVLYTNTFGCLSLTNAGSHLTLSAANTYTTITNYHYSALNGFTANKVAGLMTNASAGYYRISISVCVLAGNGDQIEGDFTTNGVPTDIIAFHTSTYNPAKDVHGSSEGVMYLPASTQLSIQIKNIDTATLAIHHCQLTVGTP